jgi:hypothetical protein
MQNFDRPHHDSKAGGTNLQAVFDVVPMKERTGLLVEHDTLKCPWGNRQKKSVDNVHVGSRWSELDGAARLEDSPGGASSVPPFDGTQLGTANDTHYPDALFAHGGENLGPEVGVDDLNVVMQEDERLTPGLRTGCSYEIIVDRSDAAITGRAGLDDVTRF